MPTVWKGITNGGANRFFTNKDGDLKVAGEGVGGRKVVTKELLADIWDAEILGSGNVTSDEANPRIQDDGLTVRLSGNGVGGNIRFVFDNEKAAKQFEAFLEELGDAGYLAEIL